MTLVSTTYIPAQVGAILGGAKLTRSKASLPLRVLPVTCRRKERSFVPPAGLCARHRGAVTTAAIIFRSLRVAPLVDIHWCLSEAFRSACTSLWLPSRLFSEADRVWQSICYRPSVAMKGDGHVSSRVVCCYRNPNLPRNVIRRWFSRVPEICETVKGLVS